MSNCEKQKGTCLVVGGKGLGIFFILFWFFVVNFIMSWLISNLQHQCHLFCWVLCLQFVSFFFRDWTLGEGGRLRPKLWIAFVCLRSTTLPNPLPLCFSTLVYGTAIQHSAGTGFPPGLRGTFFFSFHFCPLPEGYSNHQHFVYTLSSLDVFGLIVCLSISKAILNVAIMHYILYSGNWVLEAQWKQSKHTKRNVQVLG